MRTNEISWLIFLIRGKLLDQLHSVQIKLKGLTYNDKNGGWETLKNLLALRVLNQLHQSNLIIVHVNHRYLALLGPANTRNIPT